MHGAACGRASGREGSEKVLGKGVSQCGGERRGFDGEWVVRAAGLTHIRRSSTRARVLLYIRPPCPRRQIAAMGPKDAPYEHPSPAKTSAPAPSAFALPRPRSHFPRPRSHFPRIAFHFPRGAIGLPQQQLSTMGYPRKSYPHRCPPPCAKRSRPRACARVYIIYRSPVARSRGVSAPLRKRVRAVVAPCPAPPCAGWGRAKAKADAPSRSAEHAACVPNHCVQRRSAPGKPRPCPCALPAATCLRPRPRPLVCRITVCKGGSAQGNPRPCPCALPAATCLRPSPCPLVCRITVCKGGSAQGQPRPCPCALPATACLRPRPCPLMGELPCAGWGRAKAKADAPSRSNPPLSVYRPAPAA